MRWPAALPALVPVLLLPAPAMAQQGFLPLGRTVDAPYTALMHRKDVAAHSAIRPYLWEDVRALPGADSAAPPAWRPWLDHLGDPARRWHGGPLLDAQAGASFGEDEALKYRGGAGAWLGWNAAPRFTLGLDGRVWQERLPGYLARFAQAQKVVPGEGYAYALDDAIVHYDWNGYADYKAGEYFHFTLGKGRTFLGEGRRSLFLGDGATGYPYLRITTTAWHLRYMNLFTLMRDLPGGRSPLSAPSRKFASIHYLSWNVSKRVNAGFFEAIVWQDNDPRYPRGFDLSYLNPVIFLRPVEFGLGSPDNALMGIALNVKAGRQTLLYSQVALDEFLLNHVRAGDGWYGNKQGVQVGAIAHDTFGRKGLMLRAEVNYARPFMYAHTDRRQNYAHEGEALAHPYGAGFLEALLEGEWRKGPWILGTTASSAALGQDTALAWDHGNYGNNIFLSDSDRPLGPDGKPLVYGFWVGKPSQATVFQNELRAGRLLAPASGLLLELAWTYRAQVLGHGPAQATNYLRFGISAHLHDRHTFQVVR